MIGSKLLHQPGFLKCDVGATLFHGFEPFGGDKYFDLAAELRKKNGLGLHIYLTAALAGRVKLGGAYAIGIPASDD